MAWKNWKTGRAYFPDCKTNINFEEEKGWVHYLVTTRDESDPRNNHIHVKARIPGPDEEPSWVLCAVRVDGMRVINRRKLIESINEATDLDLEYR